MASNFLYDVFICNSEQDNEKVRDLATQLQKDGLYVWFAGSEIKAGDDYKVKMEEGLELSRVLVFCMSAHIFDDNWSRFESYTYRFRDPLNKDRRFIPLQLDDSPVKASLAQYLHFNWLPGDKESDRILNACRLIPNDTIHEHERSSPGLEKKVISFGHIASVGSIAFSPDGLHIVTGGYDCTILIWKIETGRCIQVLEGHTGSVLCVAWSPDGRLIASGSEDNTVRIWSIKSGKCIHILSDHKNWVFCVSWSSDSRFVVSGANEKFIRVWEVESGDCLQVFRDVGNIVTSVAFSPDGKQILSSSEDNSICLWDVTSGHRVKSFKGHKGFIWSLAWPIDGIKALSASDDKTIRLWDINNGHCLKILKGHRHSVTTVGWTQDGQYAISGSDDKTLRFWNLKTGNCVQVLKEQSGRILGVALSPDAQFAISSSNNNLVQKWDLKTGLGSQLFEGPSFGILCVAWSPDRRSVLTGSIDNDLRLWDAVSGQCLQILEGHEGSVYCIAWSPDGQFALSGTSTGTVYLWDIQNRCYLETLEGHYRDVVGVAWSADGKYAVSVSGDNIRIWKMAPGNHFIADIEDHKSDFLSIAWHPNSKYLIIGLKTGQIKIWDFAQESYTLVLEGHTGKIRTLASNPDGSSIASGSEDYTVRLWESETGHCMRVLEGHNGVVMCIAWSPDGQYLLSGSADNTVRIWDILSGRCLQILEGHTQNVMEVVWGRNGYYVFSVALNGICRVWELSLNESIGKASNRNSPAQVQYSNAKVLLVGDSGVGKTGLSNYLALNIKDEERNSSTDGAWATQWTLPHQLNRNNVEREIWLWDFAGQVDYRLVHQLFMDNTAAAVLVFNPQNENPFDGLGQWDHDLQKATRTSFARLLVAGRIDRGGLIVSNASINRFIKERGFAGPLYKTSAKTGEGCDELCKAIVKAIQWQNIPETTSPAMYYRMKQEILQLRDGGIVLIRFAELKQRMELALVGEYFRLSELKTVIGLLAGPGMIQLVDFGGFILLRPEILSRYAAAVVRKVRQHPQELGCISEEDMLAGNLDYQDFERLPAEDEAVVLRILHEIFVSRAWCLRQYCDNKALLTFPSYFRRERPQQPSHPSVLVTYRFTGHTDDIYTTLVVRLHHTEAFETEQLWHFAADFKTQTGQHLGLKLSRKPEGSARLDVYFNPDVDENSRLIFLRYIHNHLSEHATEVIRLRHYTCANRKCDAYDQPFTDREKIDKALGPGGKGKVFCPGCGKPLLLQDTMEQKFNSPAVKKKVHQLQINGQFEIDNESRELLAVHHTGFIVSEAGQIYRGYTNSDHGIDAEIEFKDDEGKATGKRLYLQLKSGDSYLKKRNRDGNEIFYIKNMRWASYWQQQAYPVMLVIRSADGEIRWMDVSEHLKNVSQKTKKPVKQIFFIGEPLNAMSVRRWRDKVLK